jgi:transcriptional regulator with XRE-family HTH domain
VTRRTNQRQRATSLTKYIGEQIRNLRRAQGISQQRFADLVCETIPEFNRASGMRIEIGQRERVSVDELFAMASALNVPYTRLLPEQGEPAASERLRAMARALDDIAARLPES